MYCYASNNPIGVAYNSCGGVGTANVGMIGSIGASVGSVKTGYYNTISNSSNVLGALSALSSAFGFFDQWSGYISGGLDGGLGFWGPKGFGAQFLGNYLSTLKNFNISMTIAGNTLSWGSSVYNNFVNPNYTTGEAIGASIMDAAYYAGKGLGTYWLGSKVGELAISIGIAFGSTSLGTTVFGTTVGFAGAFAIGGGVAVLLGIAGSVAIYYLGELIDNGWKRIKQQIFE